MKWDEARKLYPNQFVKIEILNSYIDRGKMYINEVAVIDSVRDSEATSELLNADENTLVYHTSKDEIVIEIRNRLGLRRGVR